MFLTDQLKSLNIKYYKKDTKEWLDEWNTEPQQQASQQQQLPDEIQIELSVTDDKEHETKFRETIQPVLRR